MLIKVLGLDLAYFTQLDCPWFFIHYILDLSVPGSTLTCNSNLMFEH